VSLLQLESVDAGYGGSQVLFGLSLAVPAGSMATLLGRNGMGKTTTLRTVFGLLRAKRGRVLFDGRDITQAPTDAIGRLGIGLVPEGRQVFPNLTVHEHLVAFAANRSGAADPWTAERVLALFPRLAERASHLGHQLSGGEQQMLAIGRALTTNPRLLILDEATEGLAPRVREDIWRCLALLKAQGQTLLVIDKYVERLVRIADAHTILERGRVVWHGSSAALAAERTLWQRHLGV
jgi:branched-chain amino acid transport system ATP-binding protein